MAPDDHGEDPAERELTFAEVLAEASTALRPDSWVGRQQARALAFAERATSFGPLAEAGEIGWATSRRLSRVAGAALAALVAYRVFVFLLPFALVLVAGLGVASDVSNADTSKVVELFGLTGYFASSVDRAAETGSTGRFYALALGIPFLLYQAFQIARALRAIHAVCWGVRLVPIRRPVRTTLITLVVLCAVAVVPGLVRGASDDLPFLGDLLLTAALYLGFPAAWLAISMRMPHRAPTWKHLVPGSIVVGLAAVAMHVAIVLLLVPYLESKEAVYGTLGAAAGVMLAFYGIGWAVAWATALNAEYTARVEGRRRSAAVPAAG